MVAATRQIMLLVAVVCLCVVEVRSACHVLAGVEQLLTRRFTTDKIDINLNEIAVIPGGSKGLFGQLFSSQSDQETIAEFSQNMAYIWRISDKPKCNFHEFEVFNSLDMLIYGKFLETDRKVNKCIPRIQKLYQHFLDKHVKDCKEKHREAIKQAYDSLDNEVSNFAMALPEQSLPYIDYTHVGQYRQYIIDLQRDSLLDNKIIERIAAVIHFTKEGSKYNFETISKNGVSNVWWELFDTVVLRQCHEFVQKTEYVAPMASLELVYLDLDNEFPDREERNYYKILLADHLCKLMIKQRLSIVRAITSVQSGFKH